MTQTTTQLGRTKLAHPDLAFDTDDGGTALHNALVAMWTQVSNHLPSRWTGSVTILASASTTITHNFGLALSGLKVIMFESGVQLTDTQVTASYSITQTSVNAIAIQNTTGGSKTFDALIFAYKTVITSSDLDPSANTTWDTVNGTSWNKSLYVNGPYTVATAQEYENVIVLGNLTLNANLTVRGRLVVVGNVTGNGFKFDCDGDVSIVGDVSITGIAAPTMTIGGDLVNATTNASGFVFRGNTGTSGLLTCKRNVTIINPSTLDIGVLTLAGLSNAAGNNVIIYGNATCAINTAANGTISSIGCNGGYIKVIGNVNCGTHVTGLSTIGTSGLSTFACGTSGDITIKGNLSAAGGPINLYGAGSTSATAANGGSLVVNGHVDADVGAVSTYGGTATTSGAGGNGGTITCSSTFKAGAVNSSGGSSAVGVAFSAGTAGAISIQYGNCFVSSMTANGGSGGNTTINGGAITLFDVVIDEGTIASTGGNNNGGLGGTIIIFAGVNSKTTNGGNITSTGGTSTNAAKKSGAGGTVTIWGDVTRVGVSANGGTCTSGIGGGNGGTISIIGKVNAGSFEINALGGTIYTATGACGNGGTLNFGGDVFASVVSVKGADNNAHQSTAMSAGNGGVVNGNNGNFRAQQVDISGGYVSNPTGGNGGNAGSLTINGTSHFINLTAKGGASIDEGGGGSAGTPGNCASNITITGDVFFDGYFWLAGGDATFGNGGSFNGATINGSLNGIGTGCQFIIKGGDSTKSSGTAAGGSFTGAFKVTGNWTQPSGNITICPGSATGAGLTTGTGGNGRSSAGSDPNIVVLGNINWGDAVDQITISITGGAGRTAGGKASGLKCNGVMNVKNLMEIAGGSAMNNTGPVGSIGIIHALGGGFIAGLTSLNASLGVAESAGTSFFRFGGSMTIGSLVNLIPLTKYPNTRVKVCVANDNYATAMVVVGTRDPTSILFDSTNAATNLWPQAATVTANFGSSPMFGMDTGGTTTWKYRTFANA